VDDLDGTLTRLAQQGIDWSGRRTRSARAASGSASSVDPDGNSVEAVNHAIPRQASIDHLWIRVRDLDESRQFYELIAPWSGFAPRGPHRFGVGFAGPQGSFSLIPGDEPTEHVHLAFPASDDASVDAFHRAAVEAGYRDNGPPGERPEYHAGY
jgi:hypothetical protein